jgi:hypothetical protein
LEEIAKTPPRWDTYDEFDGDDVSRLWKSIEFLDLTHSSLGALAKRARRKQNYELAVRIDQVQENVNLALVQLDPENWPRRGFMNFRDDPKRLQAALQCLEQAFMLFRDGYEQISVDIEALRGRHRPWVMETPIIYRQLRDAVYALQKYPACAKDVSVKQ